LVGIATTGIPGSDALTYKWTVFPSNGVTFGGTGANSAFPTVTFSIPRTYQFTFTATDKIGRTDSKTFSVVVADNLTPLNVALTSKGTTLQNIHQNGAARTAPLTGGDVARAAASTLNTWGTASSASRHWFQLTFPDPVTIYGVDIMWSSDGGGTNAPNAGTAGNRNELLVPAADPAVPMVNDALTVPAANWTALALKDKSGAAIDDIPRVTNGTSTNNVWNFAGFDPVDSQYLLTVLNRPGSGNGVGINYWRAYVLEPTHSVEDVYVHVTGNELENAVRQAEVFPAAYETAVKKIDFSESKYAYLNHDIALKWTQSQIDAAIAAEAGVETVVTGTNNTLGYSLRVHVVKSAAAPVVVDYVPVTVMAEVGETVSMPETVIANLDDGSQHTLPVTWDVPAGVTDTAGTKTINGAVVLPSGWTGPATLTATLSVVADARAYLADRLLAFELLSEADYISGSYATALLVYDAAKAIYDYPEALPEELTQAANDLNAAIEWLDGEKAIDAVLLDMLLDFIDLYNDLYDVEEDSGMWTPESLAAFRAAIDAAQAIADAPGNYSVNDAETALAAIIEAYDALEASVDKSLLASIIAQAESILLTDGDKLITSARVNLIAKLDAAKLVYDDAEATEAEVIAAWTDLLSAITEAGQFKGDTARLSALMSLVRNTAGTNYTPASFTAFTAALAGAQTVIDNADDYTQTRIDEAYDRLYSAWRGLTRLANFAALQAAVNAAQAIVDDIDDYVPDSVAGLADELAAAKTVLADSDSTQAEVNAASSALTAKIVLARLKEDKSKLNAAYSSAKSVKTSLYTMGSVETLSSAMEAAKIIIEAPVGDFTQAQVDKATDRVNGAVKALIRLTDVVTDAVSSVADQDDSAKAVAGDDKDKGKTEGKGGKAANSEEAVSGDIETADPAAESPAPAADDTDDVQVAAVTNADVAQIVEPATPLAQGVDAVVTGGDATVSETGAVGAVVDAARAPADGGASNIAYIVLVSLICALAGFMTFLVRSRKKQTK
jgi:hypothetical protein